MELAEKVSASINQRN